MKQLALIILCLSLSLPLIGCFGDSGGNNGSTNTTTATSLSTTPGSNNSTSPNAANSGTDQKLPDWLYTEANRIKQSDGSVWFGRGANLHDTRSCNACQNEPPHLDEVLRRADTLLDEWGATFVHFVLDSYTDAAAQQNGWVHWRDIMRDPQYKDDVVKAVEHMTTKKGVYVLLYNHNNPCNGHHPDASRTYDMYGAPTSACIPMWQEFARLFRTNPKVIYGIAAEPTSSDGTDEQIWQNYNSIVNAIRDIEDQTRPDLPYHLVAVQGTNNFGRDLSYYLKKPISARQGKNVVYETHPYDPQANFDALVFTPAKTLPVVIGEFGVELSGPQKGTDAQTLMQRADQAQIPYLAWSFHQRCPGSLLKDNSGGKQGCGVGMKLEPSPLREVKGSETWGTVFYNHLKGTDNAAPTCASAVPLTNTCLTR